ncbi:MAG TPA: MerR family transcriptional regulator [Candidatus Saccharimonadales bacterium]|nr:MerR family transcriptional regulator [Candidatus Saccharimonadales bacterium]
MDNSGAPEPVSAVGAPLPKAVKKIKIGEVARHFEVSVDLLRLYEREGLLIPLKSGKGTRYFTEADYPWIATVLRLVREARLNFAGIRHLLALLPCWDIRRCGDSRHHCNGASGATAPCWMTHNCCSPGDCYACDVYRAACQCENLKAFVMAAPA